MDEVATKEALLRALMQEKGLDALWLQQEKNFAWATGGASSYIFVAADSGLASLLYTPDGKFVITTNIEAPRLEREEHLAKRGFEVRAAPWHEAGQTVAEMTQDMKVGQDCSSADMVDLSADLTHLRMALLPEEGGRLRQLGSTCGEVIALATQRVKPGMTEHQISGILAEETLARGIWPVVNLIATDERIHAFRHPLPTEKVLAHYAMLILCGRVGGLIVSVTRLVHFGPLPDEVRRKADACAQIDAAFIAATRPGARLSDIFRQGTEAYAAVGFPDEWRLHHQGGPGGYDGREMIATFDTHDEVKEGMTFAWNPSITGVKSEDSILVGETTNEIVTSSPDWPMREVEALGQTYARPQIMVVT